IADRSSGILDCGALAADGRALREHQRGGTRRVAVATALDLRGSRAAHSHHVGSDRRIDQAVLIMRTKTILVTGANTGVGRATAEALAAQGARLLLACRDPERARGVLDAIGTAGGNVELLRMDLSELGSVKQVCDTLITRGERIDVLVNNAGV